MNYQFIPDPYWTTMNIVWENAEDYDGDFRPFEKDVAIVKRYKVLLKKDG